MFAVEYYTDLENREESCWAVLDVIRLQWHFPKLAGKDEAERLAKMMNDASKEYETKLINILLKHARTR